MSKNIIQAPPTKAVLIDKLKKIEIKEGLKLGVPDKNLIPDKGKYKSPL